MKEIFARTYCTLIRYPLGEHRKKKKKKKKKNDHKIKKIVVVDRNIINVSSKKGLIKNNPL